MRDALANLNETAGLLRVAFPRARNNATSATNHATDNATGVQQTGLKALALLAIERNKVRNNSATDASKPTQQTDDLEGAFVARVVPDLAGMRARLLLLATAELIDAKLVSAAPNAEVAECAGLCDDTLRACVRALRDTDLRERGRCPSDETARALCHHCGPVWLAPEVAAVAPVTGCWPRVLGCPWCHVKNRRAIPRPPATCGDCAHFERDRVNQLGGMGRCMATRKHLFTGPLAYPNATRQCERFEPGSAT